MSSWAPWMDADDADLDFDGTLSALVPARTTGRSHDLR
jgi:hypothetical protein